jgi:hypothetical protein
MGGHDFPSPKSPKQLMFYVMFEKFGCGQSRATLLFYDNTWRGKQQAQNFEFGYWN